jgi:hypothetical protein
MVGANFANSFVQLRNVESGATTRNGPCARPRDISAHLTAPQYTHLHALLPQMREKCNRDNRLALQIARTLSVSEIQRAPTTQCTHQAHLVCQYSIDAILK